MNPADKNQGAIISAAEEGHIEVVQLLASDSRCNNSITLDRVFVHACGSEEAELVKVLLQDKRIDPSYGGNFALHIACRLEDLEVAHLLIEDRRVRSCILRGYPFRHAYKNGFVHLGMVHMYLRGLGLLYPLMILLMIILLVGYFLIGESLQEAVLDIIEILS